MVMATFYLTFRTLFLTILFISQMADLEKKNVSLKLIVTI